MTRPLVLAHRGGAGLWPENTLFAFAQAVAAGCDGAEVDVQLTRDMKLAVFHDAALTAGLARDMLGTWLTRPGERIAESDYAYLREFDLGRPARHSAYALAHPHLLPKDGERIPELSEVIALAKSAPRPFRLFIELKLARDDARPGVALRLADAVCAVLAETAFVKRAVLVGFDWSALIRAQAVLPVVACWFSTDRQKQGPDVPRRIVQAGAQGWFPHYTDVRPATVAAARAAGLKLGAWTVNAPRDMRRLIDLGLDVLCTDYPDRLLKLLA